MDRQRRLGERLRAAAGAAASPAARACARKSSVVVAARLLELNVGERAVALDRVLDQRDARPPAAVTSQLRANQLEHQSRCIRGSRSWRCRDSCRCRRRRTTGRSPARESPVAADTALPLRSFLALGRRAAARRLRRVGDLGLASSSAPSSSARSSPARAAAGGRTGSMAVFASAIACTGRPPIGVMPPSRGPTGPPRLIVITASGCRVDSPNHAAGRKNDDGNQRRRAPASEAPTIARRPSASCARPTRTCETASI